jgi:hypothetical protein
VTINTPIAFTDFLEAWMTDIEDGNPSSVQLGSRFAHKLVTQWLDIDDSSDDVIYCDGAGDGGIDVAYLHIGDSGDTDKDGCNYPA